jgi:hypothetical protein
MGGGPDPPDCLGAGTEGSVPALSVFGGSVVDPQPAWALVVMAGFVLARDIALAYIHYLQYRVWRNGGAKSSSQVEKIGASTAEGNVGGFGEPDRP